MTRKYFGLASLFVLAAIILTPSISLAHSGHQNEDYGSDRFGPLPHYRCAYVNSRYVKLNDKWFKIVHRNWDRIEDRGYNIREVPCPSDYRNW